MVRRIGLAGIVAIVAGLALAVPSGAVAATTVGEAFDPTAGGTCSPAPRTFLQNAPAQYVMPFDGVITSWSYQAAAGPPQLKLKVGRAVEGGNFLIVAESSVEAPTADQLNTYPARLSVKTGDLLGLTLVSEGECYRPALGYTYFDVPGDPAPGTSPSGVSASGAQFDIAARLEADADQDGFGDETQDQCPTNAATAGPCPPPAAAPTGQRAAAKKKCKKKFPGKANAKKRKKCLKKAKRLPV